MKRLSITVLAVLLTGVCSPPAWADLQVGQKAELFSTVNENLRPVDMARLIDGRPLVLLVGSCS